MPRVKGHLPPSDPRIQPLFMQERIKPEDQVRGCYFFVIWNLFYMMQTLLLVHVISSNFLAKKLLVRIGTLHIIPPNITQQRKISCKIYCTFEWSIICHVIIFCSQSNPQTCWRRNGLTLRFTITAWLPCHNNGTTFRGGRYSINEIFPYIIFQKNISFLEDFCIFYSKFSIDFSGRWSWWWRVDLDQKSEGQCSRSAPKEPSALANWNKRWSSRSYSKYQGRFTYIKELWILLNPVSRCNLLFIT